MRILLAEDDPLLGDGLRAGLRQLGFQVDWVRDGEAAERELRAEPYAAAVLDLGLAASATAWTCWPAVRRAGVTLPVLVLTARDAVPDRIRGLDVGADDYVVKPVDLHELAARLRALVRRAHGQPQRCLRGARRRARPRGARGAPGRPAGAAVDARVRPAARADAQRRPRAVARAARAAALQLGPGGREQRRRGAHPPPAAQARQRADPDRARRRLHAGATSSR